MGKSYTDAVQYFFDTVSTYLRARAGEVGGEDTRSAMGTAV